MSKVIFEELYLFSSNEKKAKMISFSPQKNIITSSAVDGTDRGKSVIMKSLYHTLGADCFFEDKWNDIDKTYILVFWVDNNKFYMLRYNRLFKLFDYNKHLIFSTVSRHELAEKLKDVFSFAVKLPRRDNDEMDETEFDRLEIATPVYNYILYFLDQDKQSGSQFSSFKQLSEYPDFKENVLYYHFGAFDDLYYKLIQQQERITADGTRLYKEKEMIEMMLEKVYKSLKEVSYSQDIEHLRSDVNRTKDEYNRIAKKLNELRQQLIKLRNDKADLEYHLQALSLIDKENEKQITSLNKHVCPFCKSYLENPLDLRIQKYSASDDIILLSSDIQYNIGKLERKIVDLEQQYTNWLSKLKAYEVSINIKSAEVNDVLAHKGFIDIKEKISDDLHLVQDALSKNQEAERNVKKELKKYNDIKKRINERYYSLMLSDKDRFGLEGINAKSFENIKRTFSAGGSNNPISTVIWYINLIELKHEFNPQSVDFPVVLDSPNNAETDEEKKEGVYDYICERITDNQLIVSGIGYPSDSNNTLFDKVIVLENEKYELLCEEDYKLYSDLLLELNTQFMVEKPDKMET